MKHLLNLTLLLYIALSSAQTKLELTPDGFLPIEMKTPNYPIDQLLQGSKSWAPYYNKKGYDVSDVTQNSLKVEARVENAFYSYNVGVKYDYDIVYTLKITFQENKTYKLSISVKEIYAENVLLKTTTADFFTADRKLKSDFKDAKPSLENTINKIVRSYVGYINQ